MPTGRMHFATDEELLLATGRRREAAFAVLVERHGATIKAYALRLLRSPEQAEEVFVDTFARVAARGGRWESRGTVRGYLFTIAHRLCIDHLRQRRRDRLAWPHVVALEQERSVHPSPEAEVALGQTAQALERAIAALPEGHRQVLLLRAVHGLSSEETARVVGLDESQVRSQLSYARKHLRETLAQGGEGRRAAEGGGP